MSSITLQRILATSGGLTSLSAYGDVVAWSDRATGGQGPSPEAYHLTALVDGEVRRLPVAPRAVPFDVNLGPDRDGRTVAVYSRCAREPDLAETDDPSASYPPYTRGRGCDLYRFDFVTGAERKVAGASTDQASEVLPPSGATGSPSRGCTSSARGPAGAIPISTSVRWPAVAPIASRAAPAGRPACPGPPASTSTGED